MPICRPTIRPTQLGWLIASAAATILVPPAASASTQGAAASAAASAGQSHPAGPVQLGPRPYFLIETLDDGPLKRELQACASHRQQFVRSAFSIGHRGAPLQFPEHTRESYQAAVRMGAGIVECDVTFTRDKELVCRHAQNDLHTTTDILATPLAGKCSKPFTPAVFDGGGRRVKAASAECRTSDITLAEFRSLRGKMDASDPDARTVAEYLGGTAGWRTDLYAGADSGTLMTHRESIELFKQLGVGMAPELKAPVVAMPFDGFSPRDFALKLVDEYRQAGIPAERVRPQSFSRDDVLTWLEAAPAFGQRAVFLSAARNRTELPGRVELEGWRSQGIRTLGAPIFALLAAGADGTLQPSRYALDARAAGLELIGWSLERSGVFSGRARGFYYQGLEAAVRREGDVLRVLDVLSREVGIVGMFSDWPATTSFFANCRGLD